MTGKIQIFTNPTARFDLYREVVETYRYPYQQHTCSFCGGTNAYGKLFKYFIVKHDRNRFEPIDGQFCSINCMRDNQE